MKKFISKVKKAMSAIIIAIVFLPSKIFAFNPPPPVPLYGPPKSELSMIWKIARIFVIPIALLVGIIIYLKKSKSSKKKKILVILGIIAVTAILYFIIDYALYKI